MSGDRKIWMGFVTLGAVMAAHQLLETARDALFLASLPAFDLPWVYLAIAVLGLVVSRTRVARFSGRYALAAWLVVASAISLAFWVLLASPEPWMLYALYAWSGLYITLAVTQFWVALGAYYTVTEAKHAFGTVGTGAILGAIAGAVTARGLTSVVLTRHLVLAAALAAMAAAIASVLLERVLDREREPSRSGVADLPPVDESLKRVVSHPYTLRVAWLVVASTLAFTVLDYVFKSVVAAEVPAPELASFFATLHVVLNVGSLLAQVVLVRALVRHTSLSYTLSLLPLLLVGGAIAVAAGGGLLAALLLKGADGSLRHSVHRVGTELLFVPMSDETRTGAKLFIDIVGQRGSQAVASLAILGVVSLFGPAVPALAAVVAVLAVLWIAIAFGMREHYLDLFRKTLAETTARGTRELPSLDGRALEDVVMRLNSRDDLEVIAAIDLLAGNGKARLIPDLILYHPSPRVVLHALDVFATERRSSFWPIAERLLNHENPRIRASVLAARTAVISDSSGDAEVLHAAMNDEQPIVRATALIGLIEAAATVDERYREPFYAIRAAGGTEADLALARAIRRRPLPAFSEFLIELARSEEVEVQSEVAAAMGDLRDVRFVSSLIPMLGARSSREAARRALVAIGPAALSVLDGALADEALPARVRHHLPRTMSRFRADQAAPLMVEHLVRERDEVVRDKLLRGLGSLAANHARLEFSREQLLAVQHAELEATVRLAHWRGVLEEAEAELSGDPRDQFDLIVTLLADKEAEALERVFRVLGLLYRNEDFEGIYRGLAAERRVRDSSRELLGDTLEEPTRSAVLALLGDGRRLGLLEAVAPVYQSPPLGYIEVLEAMLRSTDETLQCAAAHHARRRGLSRLAPVLANVDASRSQFVRRATERASAQFASVRPISEEDAGAQ